MDAGKVAQLEAFIGHCKSDPSLLNDPLLGFFRDYLESLGAQIPPNSTSKTRMKQESDGMPNAEFVDQNMPKQKTEDYEEDDEIVESDIELEGEVVKPETDTPQKMGDPSVEVSDESRDVAQMLKAKAVDAISDGILDEAIAYMTVAIMLNPTSAILYATRARVFVKMRKPNAGIRDADAALQINPYSAKGYKSRGMANALLGKWEEAASDLRNASNLDPDREIQSVLKMVEHNVQKIEVHRRKYESLKTQRETRKAERLSSCAVKTRMKQESDGMPNAEFVDRNMPKQKTEDYEEDDEIVESDIELEGEVVKPENDSPQKMGDPSVEVSDESRDAAQMLKAKAVDAISDGKLDEAIAFLTEAIMLNPTSAILYATRARVFVKMHKPNAGIRDADAALQINPDSAKGYKSRGMANALLGKWEEAASDLRNASKLDHDEEIQSVLKMVEPNVQKIEVHRRKYESLKTQRETRKAERLRSCAVDSKVKSEYLAALQDGNVMSIHSSSELETKFKAASDLSRLVILYFTATWCGPCRFMAPVYKNLAEKSPKVVFLKIDIDEVSDVAHRWNVSSVPTFFFVKDGKEIDRVIGADKDGLERKIALHATKS